MNLFEPTVHNYGMFAIHDMPCAVCQVNHAVMQMNTGVFLPCWQCQEQGYELVRKNRFGIRKRISG